MADRDERIVEEFVAGAEVPTIAARYAVPEEYVDRLVEETSFTAKPKRSWSMNNWGNRLFYSVAAGFFVNVTTHLYALGAIITVVLFILTTAIITAARRN